MAWVFMDLEMKPVDKQFRRERDICRQEVIEFGAVKLGEDMTETDSFRALVKPALGEIPPRYAQLTGITNDMVAEAPDFETVLGQFAAWCEDAETVYAWSGSDLDQLRGEVKMKGIDFPLEALAGKWADFQKIFTRAVGLKRELSLEQAVNIANINFEGHQHDALWDARNTAELFRIYRDEGRFNAIIGPLREAVNPKKQTSFTLADALGDALKGLNLPEA
jgi:inhibitor of KinA sporulation pathway (predicted exonuclease)